MRKVKDTGRILKVFDTLWAAGVSKRQAHSLPSQITQANRNAILLPQLLKWWGPENRFKQENDVRFKF